MTITGKRIEFTRGNDIDVVRTISGVPAGDTLAKAWLTVKAKEADADPGLFQKEITSASVGGQGQITDTGSDTVGAVLFQITAANSEALTADTDYFYDIKVKTANGKLYTYERGVMRVAPAITLASA